NSSDQTQHQGICPNGWHLPSDHEWNQLEEVIAESAAGEYSTTGATTWLNSYATQGGSYRGTHGQKMISTTAVNNQTTNGQSFSASSNGFDALLVGNNFYDRYESWSECASLWSSSSSSESKAWRRYCCRNATGVYRDPVEKYNERSVRCKKD
ncbi:MAG: hypothetical protein LBE13_14425, partial [Bacteroidales bacterium]|nr:hypothetical protein [Bacteroidales bacterium]